MALTWLWKITRFKNPIPVRIWIYPFTTKSGRILKPIKPVLKKWRLHGYAVTPFIFIGQSSWSEESIEKLDSFLKQFIFNQWVLA